ncbi:hypothetical protein [Prosthecobacter fluviatilis]|uniref:Uncharacterized protein n=1 Tax=Prosthecobacter fluviatilis TaxID=445931 RepID=A0ABW0KXJ1_9BACT
MKALFITALHLFVAFACLTAAEPVVVPNAASPDGRFVIRLTHDRAKETDPLLEDSPNVQIVASAGNRVLVTFPYAADPESDPQPLRTHIRAHWNADGSAVALSFSERFYTHLLVYRLQGTLEMPEAFAAVTLPDTVPVIEAMIPRFKGFRSRWHLNFQGWPGRSTLQFSAGTGALIKTLAVDEDPNFMAVYSFTVDISDPRTPVIKRVELVTED